MLNYQPIPQEPFRQALREAQGELRSRCAFCPLPPEVLRVRDWNPELWIQVWSDAAGVVRRHAGLALNDGLTGEACRGYWLAALLYRTACRFLRPESGDPRYALLTTGEAACRRMTFTVGDESVVTEVATENAVGEKPPGPA